MPNSFMDATLRIETDLTGAETANENQRFCNNGKYLDFPYTGIPAEFSHVLPLLSSLLAGGNSYSLFISIFTFVIF